MVAITLISVSLAALLSCVGAQNITTGALGNASVVVNNPPGAVYVATLPTTEFNNPSDPRGNVKGSIAATANPNGIGISFSVSFSNLPTSGGPFLYHIHDQPVSADGNCNNTLGHLDPYVRGEVNSSLDFLSVQNANIPRSLLATEPSHKRARWGIFQGSMARSNKIHSLQPIPTTSHPQSKVSAPSLATVPSLSISQIRPESPVPTSHFPDPPLCQAQTRRAAQPTRRQRCPGGARRQQRLG
jgi:hypothetical protein